MNAIASGYHLCKPLHSETKLAKKDLLQKDVKDDCTVCETGCLPD